MLTTLGPPAEEERIDRMMRSAIEQSSDSVLIFDGWGRVSFANRAYLRWSGWSHAQVLSTPVWRLPGRPGRLRDLRWARRRLSAGRAWQRDYELRPIDEGAERRFGFLTISPIRDGDDTHFIAVGRDVTRRHRLESIAEAHNLHNNLGLVFSGIRHELGNPVNSVKMALRVVRDSLPDMDPARLRRYLERIGQEVERMEYLLGSLRSYNLFQRPQPTVLDTETVLSRFVSLAREDVERRRVSFDLLLHPGLDTVYADAQALHQVLLNLLANACEAVAGRPLPEVLVEVRNHGPHVQITLRDNGPGMSPEVLENVFKPFFTTRKSGTGLGLAICRRLASEMRGTVEMESSGRGTAVTVTLDRQAPEKPIEGMPG